jgi:hypothetical protein
MPSHSWPVVDAGDIVNVFVGHDQSSLKGISFPFGGFLLAAGAKGEDDDGEEEERHGEQPPAIGEVAHGV